MFTLKIKWTRWEGEAPGKPIEVADETELFILAERIEAHGRFDGGEWRDKMKAWETGQYMQYVSHTSYDAGSTGETVWQPSRLVHVIHRDNEAYYLCSAAWVMLDGKTIERIAP